jgi:hypothetical protein
MEVTMSIDELAVRVRGEYAEMPGLRLTLSQAAKLWHRDGQTCRAVLDHLVAERFLFRTSDGAYMMWPAARRSAKAFITLDRSRRSA